PTAAHSNVAALPDFSADRRRAGVANLSGAAPRPPCAPGQIAGRPHPFSVLIVPDCFVPARVVAARRGGAVLQLAVFDPVADVALPTGGAVRPVAGPAAGVAPGPGVHCFAVALQPGGAVELRRCAGCRFDPGFPISAPRDGCGGLLGYRSGPGRGPLLPAK